MSNAAYDLGGLRCNPYLFLYAQPDKLFQMTVTRHHPINGAGLKKALAALHNVDSARLYFVVPPTIFDEFTKQTIKRSESDDHNVTQVVQYVMKVDI